MIKRISYLLFLVLIFALTGCTNTEVYEAPHIITTSQPLQYLVSNMLDENVVAAKCLLPVGGSGHEFDPTISDISSVANSVAFVCTGNELEAWANDIFTGAGGEGAFINASQGITLLESKQSSNYEDSENYNHKHSEHFHGADPHIWTSPKNMIIMAGNLYNSLCELGEKSGISIIDENAYNNLVIKLNELDGRCNDLLQMQKQCGKTLYFGDAFAFTYLMSNYGFEFESTFPGCSNSVEPSLTRIAEITNMMKNDNSVCIFKAEASNGEIAKSIAKNVGAQVLVLHSCHNLSKNEALASEDYFSLMSKNLDAIESALRS